MQVALRVLAAINENRQPDPADVAELHRMAPPAAFRSLSELACAVIQQALERRSEGQAAGQD